MQIEDANYVVQVYITSMEGLTGWLADDFNWERALRRIPVEKRVSYDRNTPNGGKKLVTSLFMCYILNRKIHQNAPDADLLSPIEFSYNEYGKPAVPGLEFNVSTSNEVISIAISHQTVGIDLSHSQQNISSTQFIEEFRPIFHPEELKVLQSMARDKGFVVFNQLWTLKEAYTKYKGLGLNMDLKSFWFDLAAKGRLVKDWEQPTDYEKHGQLGVQWTEKIPIRGIDKTLVCKSAILKLGLDGKAPVILSVISEHEDFVVERVDFERVLETEVNRQ